MPPPNVAVAVFIACHEVPSKRTNPSASGFPPASWNPPPMSRSPSKTKYSRNPVPTSKLQPASTVQVLPSYAIGSAKPEISLPFQTTIESLLGPSGTACQAAPSQRCMPPEPVDTDT